MCIVHSFNQTETY